MDIWIKRKDYNKLLQILPKELPEGYFVRSPLTKEGYDRFHTLVYNGNGISMDPEWLKQYQAVRFLWGWKFSRWIILRVMKRKELFRRIWLRWPVE